MKKIRIPHTEIRELLSGEDYDYPKYTTQVMNLANQNSQGTRPKNVGQMSDLIQEFDGKSIEEWEQWYLDKHPDSIEKATEKVYEMVKSIRKAAQEIDKEMVRKWVEELVIVKTFAGLKFQEAILRKIAEEYNKNYRLANRYEESLGIDGYINDTPVSIKPVTYKSKQALNEEVAHLIIYYEKKRSGITIFFEESVIKDL